jgi:hypothetical protein
MHGLEISFVLSRGLTSDDIERNNAIAHWMNENAIVRLCALMEYRKLIPREGEGKIDQDVQGWKELDPLRRLRNIFAHKSSGYNPNNRCEKRFVTELITYLRLNIDEPTDFPLDIARVIDPLFEGCKSYVRRKLGTA